MKRLVRSGFDTGNDLDRLYMVTLTAPGSEDTKHGASAVPGLVEAWWWNDACRQGWSWWVTAVRRALGFEDGDGRLEFVGVWEVQKRGVLHRHVIVRVRGVSDRAFRSAVRRATEAVYHVDGGTFGWGTQRDVKPINSFAAARYIAKYVTKGGERATLMDSSTGALSLDGKGYRTWSASNGWGERMGAIRASQRQWAASAGRGLPQGGPTGAAAGAAAGSDLEPNKEFYASEAELLCVLRDVLGASSV